MANLEKTPITMVPHGLVMTRKWLLKQGIERHTLDNWVKSGQIVSIQGGVYKRPDTKLTWQGVVCSLQQMEYGLCPGGVTALEFQGMGHYLSLSSQKSIHLYGVEKLPAWINKLLPNVRFIRHNERQLFRAGYLVNHVYDSRNDNLINGDPLHGKSFTNALAWGSDEWPLTVSSPERAFFEILMDVPDKISFEHADQLMQSMATLSPRRLDKLLERCKNIKVRRLFLWFAERHKHAWYDKLNLEHCNMQNHTLGSGKRVLVKGGKLDPKYLITVPPEMYQPKENHGQE